MDEKNVGLNELLGDQFRPFTPLEDSTAHGAQLPSFPVGALPTSFGEWVTDTARSLQVPADASGCLCLGVLSLAICGRVVVEVKGNDWREHPVLWLFVSMGSGDGKSPAFSRALQPVFDFESALQKSAETRIADIIAERKSIEAELRRTVKALANNDCTDLERDQHKEALSVCERKKRELPSTNLPSLILRDATPEAFTGILAEQAGGLMGWMSPEADILSLVTGQYGKGPKFDNMLSMHCGERIAVARKGDGGRWYIIERPLVPFVIMAQPVVVQRLAHRQGDIVERGFIPRFLFSLPTSLKGSRRFDVPSSDPNVHARYCREVTNLLREPVKEPGKERVLGFTPEAKLIFADFYDTIEIQRGHGAELEHMGATVAKLHGACARLAGVLHMADPHKRMLDKIDVETMQHAVTITNYFLVHARRAYSIIGAGRRLSRAVHLWGFIVRHFTNAMKFTRRDLHQLAKGTYHLVSDLDEPLRTLVEHGYVAESADSETGSRGRPRGPIYIINPDALNR